MITPASVIVAAPTIPDRAGTSPRRASRCGGWPTSPTVSGLRSTATRRVAGPTAAAVLGFDGYALRPPFHVTVLRGRDVGRVGHRVHTTTDLPLIDRTRVADIPLTSGARTLIDLARTASRERLTVALDSALRDGS